MFLNTLVTQIQPVVANRISLPALRPSHSSICNACWGAPTDHVGVNPDAAQSPVNEAESTATDILVLNLTKTVPQPVENEIVHQCS